VCVRSRFVMGMRRPANDGGLSLFGPWSFCFPFFAVPPSRGNRFRIPQVRRSHFQTLQNRRTSRHKRRKRRIVAADNLQSVRLDPTQRAYPPLSCYQLLITAAGSDGRRNTPLIGWSNNSLQRNPSPGPSSIAPKQFVGPLLHKMERLSKELSSRVHEEVEKT